MTTGEPLPDMLDQVERRIRERVEAYTGAGYYQGVNEGLRMALDVIADVRRERDEIDAEHVPGRVY